MIEPIAEKLLLVGTYIDGKQLARALVLAGELTNQSPDQACCAILWEKAIVPRLARPPFFRAGKKVINHN
ncbi:MAG: hypothetical protein ABI946_02175 [Chthoniobacterales bacterium]